MAPIDKEYCVSCFVCEHVCPAEAISVKVVDGFLRPVIHNDKCINCDICRRHCPEYAPIMTYPAMPVTEDIYMCKGTDEFWRDSKSGGIFPIIAKYFIDNGWYVAGAVYEEKLNVKHIVSDKWEDVQRMRGSKYVQSDMSEVVPNVKRLLTNNKYVLFSGTPCQVHAIKDMVGNCYNLFTIDIWCHGVGSPEKWQEHLTETFGNNFPISVSYGNKESGKAQEIVYTFVNGERKVVSTREDKFYQTLMREERLPACLDCRYSQAERQGDFTLGDFWRAWRARVPELMEKCVGNIVPSFIMFNSDKAKQFIDIVRNNTEFFERISFEEIITNNRWGSIRKHE